MNELLKKLDTIRKEAVENITQATSEENLEKIRIAVLGKKGSLKAILKQLGSLPGELRGQVGKKANEVKAEVQSLLTQGFDTLKKSEMQGLSDSSWMDVSLPGTGQKPGTLHPITQIMYEIEEIFMSMGFMIFDGPWAEDEYHNFEALNIPADHPARDMQDTFWLTDGNLLRTHTSAVQIRAMEKHRPPIRGISPGRAFRYEAVDASHENTFYQVEGLMVDRDISVANLVYMMDVLLREIFRREVKVRLRPGFFPFVEPGFELDIACLICDGAGCSVCKHSGWVELLPCGLVNPNVLRYCRIDPDEWSGFAFGLGLDRLVMMRYGVDDIRYFHQGDLRFLKQF